MGKREHIEEDRGSVGHETSVDIEIDIVIGGYDEVSGIRVEIRGGRGGAGVRCLSRHVVREDALRGSVDSVLRVVPYQTTYDGCSTHEGTNERVLPVILTVCSSRGRCCSILRACDELYQDLKVRRSNHYVPEATRYTTFLALGASRKPQEMWKELAEVRGTQPGDRVPASRRREALSAAARVRAARDVVERVLSVRV